MPAKTLYEEYQELETEVKQLRRDLRQSNRLIGSYKEEITRLFKQMSDLREELKKYKGIKGLEKSVKLMKAKQKVLKDSIKVQEKEEDVDG